MSCGHPFSHGFRHWLRLQRHRTDPIGDLARDFERDRCMPAPEWEDLTVYEAHMREHDALDSAIIALWTAWVEWNKAAGHALTEGRIS